jgi:O-antigen biosynthesis protein
MLDIAVMLAGPDISGGVAVILEHTRNLARFGHRVVLVTREPCALPSLSWHPAYSEIEDSGVRLCTIAEVAEKRFDIAVATYWRTAFDLYRIPADKYLYFVQSIESRFTRPWELDLKILIDGTYELGLGIITITSWMRDYLQAVHRTPVAIARNGINKELFTRIGSSEARTSPGVLRVLVEGATDVEFKNVPSTVRACQDAGLKDIWLLTNTRTEAYPGVTRVFSSIPMADAARVYRSCDILVKLSLVEGMFGPPLEMFHCGGTALVFDVTGHEEYIEHGKNAVIVKTGDYSAVKQWLQYLARSPQVLQLLKEGASETARGWLSWLDSTAHLEKALMSAAQSASCQRHELKVRTQRLWSLFSAGRLLQQKSAIAGPIRPECVAQNKEYVAQLTKELDEIKRSTCWRITSPFRTLGTDYPALRRLARSMMGQRTARPE